MAENTPVTPLEFTRASQPSETDPPVSPGRRFLWQWLIWTLVALYFTSQAYTWTMMMREAGKPPMFASSLEAWQKLMVVNFSCYYIWWAYTPLILWLKQRFPVSGAGLWRRVLGIHLPASLLLTFIQLVLMRLILKVVYHLDKPWDRFMSSVKRDIMDNFHTLLLTYWAIIGVYLAFDYYRKFRARELLTARLEKELTDAQLQALKMQLHPHFLFNTLNSIAALMHQDVDAADKMLVRLSDLLRRALDFAGAQEVSLRQEMNFLQPYLEIEQIRFADRLEVSFDLAPETLDARVPNLILQPLVENAVRHGIAPRAGPGRIEVRARREGDSLILEVNDNGVGKIAGGGTREGVGLSNSRARLERLYGGNHRFTLENRPWGGLSARVVIPFQAGQTGAADV